MMTRHLRVGQVANGLAEELQSAQTALAATNKIIGTVLDLRFADGGDLAAATAAGDVFAKKNQPLAILVNGETRGAAAALGAALRDAREGLVLGGTAAELKPDIAVAATNGNLATFIDHTSEADLVREKIKDGDEDDSSPPSRPAEPQKPYIHDPALARAVDLIKALAGVRQNHA